MRTHFLRAAVSLAGAVAMLQGCTDRPQAVGAASTDFGTTSNRNVRLQARCDPASGATGTAFQLDQLRFSVERGGTINWISQATSNVAIEIIPKGNLSGWAKLAPRPIPPGKTSPMPIPPDADPGEYRYSIRFICNPAAQPDTVLIDPIFILT